MTPYADRVDALSSASDQGYPVASRINGATAFSTREHRPTAIIVDGLDEPAAFAFIHSTLSEFIAARHALDFENSVVIFGFGAGKSVLLSHVFGKSITAPQFPRGLAPLSPRRSGREEQRSKLLKAVHQACTSQQQFGNELAVASRAFLLLSQADSFQAYLAKLTWQSEMTADISAARLDADLRERRLHATIRDLCTLWSSKSSQHFIHAVHALERRLRKLRRILAALRAQNLQWIAANGQDLTAQRIHALTTQSRTLRGPSDFSGLMNSSASGVATAV